jgi:hypothetical protein
LFSVFRISAFQKVDAASFPAHTRRMAKKAAAKPTAVGSARCADRTSQRDVPTTKKDNSLAPSDGERAGVRGRPSSLLDTRVVYCGDNLEQLAKLPDACNSAFRTPHSAIAVTGSFYYHCDWHASHYVILDEEKEKKLA